MGFINQARERKNNIEDNPIITPLTKPLNQIQTPEKKTIITPLSKPLNQIQTPEVSKNEQIILKTKFDLIYETINTNPNNTQIAYLSKITGLKKEIVKIYLGILKKQGLIKLEYPLNFFSDVLIKIDKKEEKEEEKVKLPSKKTLLDNYSITVDNVTGKVNIWTTQNEDVPIYELILPKIGFATKAFIDYMINYMAKITSIEQSEITDSKKNEEQKEKFFNKTKIEIKEILPTLPETEINTLTGIIIHNMYGLGDMEIIMGDNWLEEIAINGSKVPVSVYHKRYGWTKTTINLKNENEIYNFAAQVGRKVGRQINSLNPLMDAHLLTGDRVAATLAPISTAGNTITIRRFSRNPWTMIHLVDPEINTMSPEIAAFLWLCIQYELNIMVAGGTASGKTSVLNCVCSLIPATQRIISIEDTREIALPEALHWNWVPMSSRKANPEGQGEISMLDLMVESLRMRPDRIIVGEVRRKEQAETLFETMHTGHSVYATMHADSVEQVERRLLEPPLEIPKTEIGALQLIIVQYRDRRKGSRRTLEVAEILNQETDNKNLSLNYLFRWKPRSDTFEKINDSIRIMEDLNMHTGMTNKDLEDDLKKKENILKWMVKHNVKDVDTVGKIMKIYYKSPEIIINASENDLIPKEVVKD